ncbi:MAG: capsule assembly Wzi family protein [Bacteroidota bacterium]
MKKIIAAIVIGISIMFNAYKIMAQTVPVGTPVIEDAYRRAQLLGKLDSNVSFTVRPLYPLQAFRKGNASLFYLDNDTSAKPVIYTTKNGKGLVQLLPITLMQQYNTHNPYGWNDGAMIPANGYQTLFSAGFYAKYKFLSVQFRPEFVYAENKFFDGFTQAQNEERVWKAFYGVKNGTDMPERFGSGAYTKLLPGQSSIRLNFDPVSVGVSTENLWWGPGVRNSLLMSNTATGFLHATLNTTRPIATPIGSFEGQVVGGKLVGSGYSPLVLGQPGNRDDLYKPKPDNWRYFSGLVLTYHPKWVPGLFLGLTRSFQTYQKDMGKSFNDYFPVFTGVTKVSTYDPVSGLTGEDAKNRDQLTSLFVRWYFTGAQAELYFEYGKNDHNWDLRDLFLDPQHSRAYLWGFKKIFNAGSRGDEHIQVSAEVSELSASANDVAIRHAGIWYTHSTIKQGYTNNGEVIGAGIGPGGSLQSLDISWFKGLKRLGLQVERYKHNQDLYYNAVNKGELRRHWVDLAIGLSSDWDYKNLLFSARMMYINQLNYQLNLKDDYSLFYFNYKRHDANNFQFGLNVAYRF